MSLLTIFVAVVLAIIAVIVAWRVIKFGFKLVLASAAGFATVWWFFPDVVSKVMS